MTGYVHSIESFGTVDGPGVRMVVFLKGCPMRCLYCHNPDTWDMAGGTEMTVEEILGQFEAARSFYSRGGLTVSGGEPLMQPEFVAELFRAFKERGIHTCLDTSGATFRPEDPKQVGDIDRLLAFTDLVMLDIKHMDPEGHQRLCGRPVGPILEFARHLDGIGVDIWIRHVVVPGITDDGRQLYELGRFIGGLRHAKALDVLPYHTMGQEKYRRLGLPIPLEGVPPLPREEAVKARQAILNGMRDERSARTCS